MTVKEFLNTLSENPSKPLLFEYRRGAYARMDYHLTEIKNVHFDTVDCGGVRNEWKEVHVQLWENTIPEPNHRVDSTKAVKIFNAVHQVRPSWEGEEVKFEYGNDQFHTAVLPVGAIDVFSDKLIVRLGEEHTTCKAKDRAATPEEAAACCAPSDEVETSVKFDLSTLLASEAPQKKCC